MSTRQTYSSRDKCVICNTSNLTDVFEVDTQTPISLRLYDQPSNDVHFIPYNVLRCGKCLTYQTKYIGNLDMIYGKNHVDSFGSVKNEMHCRFAEFVAMSEEITGILEIGASTDALAFEVIKRMSIKTPYCIVDPDFRGDRETFKVYDEFIENIDIGDVDGNTILMSNVFEHMYNPVEVIANIQRHPKNKYIFINHPNFSHCCASNIYQILNVEHTFYIENDFIVKILNNIGYTCVERENYETHTVLFKFERTHDPLDLPIENVSSDSDISRYFERMNSRVAVINKLLQETSNKVFMWPASIHTTALFTGGLDYTKLSGLLDNSPTKIGKFFYGYNLECFSLKDIMNTCDKNTTIILGGSDCYLKELKLNTTNATIIYLKDL